MKKLEIKGVSPVQLLYSGGITIMPNDTHTFEVEEGKQLKEIERASEIGLLTIKEVEVSKKKEEPKPKPTPPEKVEKDLTEEPPKEVEKSPVLEDEGAKEESTRENKNE